MMSTTYLSTSNQTILSCGVNDLTLETRLDDFWKNGCNFRQQIPNELIKQATMRKNL